MRMFDKVTKTWNPHVGCDHECVYCWARDMAATKLKHMARYRDGFHPHLVEEELGRRFHDDSFVFTVDMGDLWCQSVPSESITRVLDVVKLSPRATFLMLTKNPRRYDEFLASMPPNVVLGATIESNRNHGVSKAPSCLMRAVWMVALRGRRKMLSIEPILQFDRDCMVNWVRAIRPEFVYLGYDNYRNRLPEPSLDDTNQLIMALRDFTIVHTKTLRKAWWEE